ncbi:glycosyltransferase [Anatilimnocola floriformis]|uniref:glycosyltransferase n=1 Tax=Anatilimnocola floriformis TaxID=2948575 RepID=UPI0020C35470|nr:glycosyltransferase [Anatilimnocola floriformis]
MKKSNQPRGLCVAIIARDAAMLIHQTLESIRDLAAEVVVLNTGSHDTTSETAALAGARVINYLWDDNFAGARNALLPHIRSPWILWLDAGETLLPGDAALLKQFVEDYADDGRAYFLRVATPPAAGQIGGEQVARLRLHANRPGLIFHGRVRESLQRSLTAFNMEAEHLPLTIQRSNREHNPQIKADRARRNIRLADLQIAQKGPTADMLNCLGEAHQALQEHPQATQHFRRAQELAAANSTEMLEAYYGLLTSIPGPNAVIEQMQLCLTAIEQFPLDAQLLCALGGYLQSTQRMELAIRSFAVAAEHGQVNSQLWHLPDIREIAISCHTQLLQQQGQIEAAARTLEQGIARYPQSQRLLTQRKKMHSSQESAIRVDVLENGMQQRPHAATVGQLSSKR